MGYYMTNHAWHFWIGLNKINDTYEWDSGTNVSWKNFAPRQIPGGDCGVYEVDFDEEKWYTDDCNPPVIGHASVVICEAEAYNYKI